MIAVLGAYIGGDILPIADLNYLAELRVAGFHLTSHDEVRRARQYGVGRICREPGCGTVLSRYNKYVRCEVHKFGRSLLAAGLSLGGL